ncbi:MAG: folate-binding protein [Pseudomonadota bacterium]|nr:folate-binding protein [Pseudomonadota bacterium]
MPRCKIAALPDRTVLRVGGEEARKFLQGLVTNDMDRVSGGKAIHAALLTPQGKILFDFLIVEDQNSFLLDCPREVAAELAKRLTFYRLRAKVEIADMFRTLAVSAIWGAEPQPATEGLLFQDPRLAELGYRLIAPPGAETGYGCESAMDADYHAHRIALGVPEGGRDFAFGDTFPHEADFDQLAGVDFKKGCYVGQEVVSRMHHRANARKRVVPVEGDGPIAAGTQVTAGDFPIGIVGSVTGKSGLALLRLDRAVEALAKGERLRAGTTEISLRKPHWATFDMSGADKGAV